MMAIPQRAVETQLKSIIRPQQVSSRRTTLERNIHAENQTALMRRWKMVNAGVIDQIRNLEQVFPGQRGLFDSLADMSAEEVAQMADCTMPIFSLRLPHIDLDMLADSRQDAGGGDAGRPRENFFALLDRVDARRTDAMQASIIYDSLSAVGRCTAFVARELEAVAADPGVSLVPCVSDEYFRFAVRSHMTCRERTILAVTHRRHRNS